MNRMATVVQPRMLLSNTQQLALMSTEISLRQTWKIARLCWKEGVRACQECVPCVSLAAEKQDLGRGIAGDTTQHHTTQPFSECVCNQIHQSLLAGG